MAGGQGRFDGLADGKERAPRRDRVQQATGTLGVPRSVQKALQEQPSRTESRPQGNAGQLRFDFLGRSAARPGIQGRPAGRGEARASALFGRGRANGIGARRHRHEEGSDQLLERRAGIVRQTRVASDMVWVAAFWCWPSRIRHSR